MTVFMSLLTRLWVQNRQFSCPRVQEEPFPRETARIRTKQIAILAGEWLYKLVDGAKRVAPTAMVVALRILR